MWGSGSTSRNEYPAWAVMFSSKMWIATKASEMYTRGWRQSFPWASERDILPPETKMNQRVKINSIFHPLFIELTGFWVLIAVPRSPSQSWRCCPALSDWRRNISSTVSEKHPPSQSSVRECARETGANLGDSELSLDYFFNERAAIQRIVRDHWIIEYLRRQFFITIFKSLWLTMLLSVWSPDAWARRCPEISWSESSLLSISKLSVKNNIPKTLKKKR